MGRQKFTPENKILGWDFKAHHQFSGQRFTPENQILIIQSLDWDLKIHTWKSDPEISVPGLEPGTSEFRPESNIPTFKDLVWDFKFHSRKTRSWDFRGGLPKLIAENHIPIFQDLGWDLQSSHLKTRSRGLRTWGGGKELEKGQRVRERDIWVPVIADCQLATGNQTRVDTRDDEWIEWDNRPIGMCHVSNSMCRSG